jgi:hypothetical protein
MRGRSTFDVDLSLFETLVRVGRVDSFGSMTNFSSPLSITLESSTFLLLFLTERSAFGHGYGRRRPSFQLSRIDLSQIMMSTHGTFYLAEDDMDDCMEIVLRSLENDNYGGGGTLTGLPEPPTAEECRSSSGDIMMMTSKPSPVVPWARPPVPQQAVALKIGGSPDEDNLSSKIRYLDKKQVVMTKASTFLAREAAYNAATAMQVVAAALNAPYEEAADTIWDEAKESLKEDSKEDTTSMQPPEPRRPRGGANTKTATSPVHPDILKALNKTVARIAAGEFHKVGVVGSLKRPMMQRDLPLNAMKVEGSWVSDCLRSWTNASARNVDSAWKMSEDARTHAMSLIPPRGTVLPAITTIQAALSCLDNEARLVVQAAPPFRVVHANRSFRLLVAAAATTTSSGGGRTGDSGGGEEQEQLLAVVGRPLERFVEVTNPSRSTSAQQNQQQAMDGVITLRGQTRKACHVRLCPVAEQQHNHHHHHHHNHHHHHTFERPISHFVVSFTAVVVAESATELSSSTDSDANDSYGSNSSSGPVIGTVG